MKLKPIIAIFCFILSLTVIFAVSCAKPPTEEMQNAREAVFRAENDPDAAQFASDILQRARASLQLMQEEANKKRFDSAKMYAAEAISLAERALLDGKSSASRTGGDSADLVAGLRPEITETERNVNGARYSQLDLDYNELEKAIVNAHEGADRAEACQADGRFKDAVDIVRDVQASLSRINGQVAGAATIKNKK